MISRAAQPSLAAELRWSYASELLLTTGVPMAKSIAQLTEQMQRIQRQIEAAKAKEVAGVVARIQEAIAHYELTPSDLFPEGGKRRRRIASEPATAPRVSKGRLNVGKEKAAKIAGSKLPAKFSDGAGNSWSGRGSTPRWLVEAIASGRKKEDFSLSV